MIKIKKDNQIFEVSKATYQDMFKCLGYTIVKEEAGQKPTSSKTKTKKIVEEEDMENILDTISKDTEKAKNGENI